MYVQTIDKSVYCQLNHANCLEIRDGQNSSIKTVNQFKYEINIYSPTIDTVV